MRLRSVGGKLGTGGCVAAAQPPVASSQEVSYPEEAGGWRVMHRGTGGGGPGIAPPAARGGTVPCAPPFPTSGTAVLKVCLAQRVPREEGLLPRLAKGACPRRLCPLPREGLVPVRPDPEECDTRGIGLQSVPAAAEPSLIAPPGARASRRVDLPCD